MNSLSWVFVTFSHARPLHASVFVVPARRPVISLDFSARATAQRAVVLHIPITLLTTSLVCPTPAGIVVVIAIVGRVAVAAPGELGGACFSGGGGRIGRLQEDGGKNETAHRIRSAWGDHKAEGLRT